jgi:hypothetical protein
VLVELMSWRQGVRPYVDAQSHCRADLLLPGAGGVFSGSGVNFQWNGSSLNRPDQISDPYHAGPVAANPDPLCQATISQGGRAADRTHTLQTWFNPCAYTPAADGELGNANRAPLSGPHFVNTDFSAIKSFPLPFENMKLQFRAEVFNVFNHAQFYLSGAGSQMQDISALSSFAVVNSTAHDPRVIQFALRLDF